ncbi:MAG: MMPL family transporter [Planctomycetota bacterium]
MSTDSGMIVDRPEPHWLVLWYRFRWFLAGFGLLCFVIAVRPAMGLDYDRSITALVDQTDPDLVAYRRLQNDFGGNAAILLVYRDGDLWTDEGMQRVAAISGMVEQLDGVSSVLSPSVLGKAVRRIRPLTLFSQSSPLLDANDPIARGFDAMFVGYTHSAEHDRAAVVAILDPDRAQTAVLALKELSKSLHTKYDGIDDVTLIGEPVLIHEAFEMIIADGRKLAWLTILLLTLVLILALGSLRSILLSALVVGWSWTMTTAIMASVGMQLSLVSTILMAIVTVIAVTSTLHLVIAYLRRRRIAYSSGQSVVFAGASVGLAIAMTCLTDAAGFAALLSSQIAPVRAFGAMVAISAFMVLVGLCIFAPLVLGASQTWFSRKDQTLGMKRRGRRMASVQRRLRRFGQSLASVSIRYRAAAFTLALAAMVIAGWASTHAETETSFLRNFERDSELVVGYDRIENHFGGAGVWDVTFEVNDPVDGETLEAVLELEDELRSITVEDAKLSKVLSIADADRVLQNQPVARLLPAAQRLRMMRQALPDFHDALLSEAQDGKRRMRIMLRSEEDLPTGVKRRLINTAMRTASHSRLGNDVDVTGYYVLMANLIEKIVRDGWRSFAAAIAIVSLLIMVYTKSWRLGLVAVGVNTLPSLIVLALAGGFGEALNMGSAMIAAVSIGLSIDGSIHFLAFYNRTKRRGHSANRSATVAAGRLGVPMTIATVALIFGFGVMGTSEFVPTSTFGILVAATMALGTLINFTIMPACVVLVDRT